jgi:UDP-galactopyranose mutase
VLALVPDEWDGQWQPRHHILTRLARYFHVVWVNPARYWREKTGVATVTVSPISETTPGFKVYNPERWLPKIYRPQWLGRFTIRQRLQRARQVLLRYGCKQIVLYLWRPEFGSALENVAFDLSCYHIDDEYSFSETEAPISQPERQLLAAVDQVFIHSPALMEKKGWINQNTAFVPNGVDYEAFASLVPEPDDVAAIPRPRIGYSGWIKKALDWPLLLKLSRQHPEWSFVFVGEAMTEKR